MHAVIFDIDGTLLESASVDDTLYREAVVSVLGDVRFRVSLADYDYVTDSGIVAQVFEDNGIAHAHDDILAIKSHFVRSLPQATFSSSCMHRMNIPSPSQQEVGGSRLN